MLLDNFAVLPIYSRKLLIDYVVVNSGRSKSASTKASLSRLSVVWDITQDYLLYLYYK